MGKNILMGGAKELDEIKKELIELSNATKQKEDLETLEKELEKSIAKKEKEIEDEITRVTQQRRAQIESTIDVQINKVNEVLKKVQSQKDKAKKKAVIKRIDQETADYRSEEEELDLGGKSIFKQENIPFLYNNRLFFALFFPSGLGDLGIIIVSIAIVFFIIPLAAYNLIFDSTNVLYLALCYVVTIILFGGAYLVLGKMKCKHNEALNRVKEIRKLIQKNKSKQRQIKQQIVKDKDETNYGLEDFDSEIETLERSKIELLEQKRSALAEFDATTSEVIQNQIISNHESALNEQKSEYQKVYNQNRENLSHVSNLAVHISTKYEGLIGKEFLTIEKIEQLEQLIVSGNAKTIGEALAEYTQKQ